KLLRLAGVDQLHTGAIVGKMEGNVREILEMNEWLRSDFYGLKPVLPVASGGVDPTRVPRLLDLAGTELVINAGGGIHGHPCGTRAGARALRQSMDAWMAGKSLRDYAKTHVELGQALEEWGNR
ncbi:ribulose 1,5-bisphosphate carboxylase, partial [Candidatus Micrarchaeota archaeon CG10_big_fil_rev_8_21_14_0_10_60_32]